MKKRRRIGRKKKGEIKVGKEEWEGWREKTFKMVVDNEAVAGIAVGMNRWRTRSLRMPFERIVRRMGEWLDQ